MEQRKLMDEGGYLRGRQILWIIYAWYKTKSEMGSIYSISDILLIQLSDDSKLQQFQHAWIDLIDSVAKRPDDAELCLLYTSDAADE